MQITDPNKTTSLPVQVVIFLCTEDDIRHETLGMRDCPICGQLSYGGCTEDAHREFYKYTGGSPAADSGLERDEDPVGWDLRQIEEGYDADDWPERTPTPDADAAQVALMLDDGDKVTYLADVEIYGISIWD